MKEWHKNTVGRFFCCVMFLTALSYGMAMNYSTARAAETSVFKGNVSDVDGKAVEGAMIYVYNSPEVRRAAEYISAPTGKDGIFRIVMPPGEYWAVARLKKAEGFGPLMPGDKHSGDPEEIALSSDSDTDMDFVVADLKEAIRMKRESRERPFKITGRIIDENGTPVRSVYALVNKNKELVGIPDYLSAWVDSEGRYTLYVPGGKYFIGGAQIFPPGNKYFIYSETTFDADTSDLDIVMKTADNK